MQHGIERLGEAIESHLEKKCSDLKVPIETNLICFEQFKIHLSVLADEIRTDIQRAGTNF